MNSLPRTDKREPGQEAGVTQPLTGKYALQSNKHVLVLLKPVNWYFLIDRLTVTHIDGVLSSFRKENEPSTFLYASSRWKRSRSCSSSRPVQGLPTARRCLRSKSIICRENANESADARRSAMSSAPQIRPTDPPESARVDLVTPPNRAGTHLVRFPTK